MNQPSPPTPPRHKPLTAARRSVQVLHGADSDIVWLQRDFGLYIVNMFDTGQASRVLALPRFSLAFLYKKYCNVDADKQYQLADWRLRPLTEEMFKYAREDTHYLLYTYDRIRLDLRAAAPPDTPDRLLLQVHRRSADVALRLYQKPVYDDRTYTKELARRADTTGRLEKVNVLVFAQLHAWRDKVARQFDESWAYVLPSYMLLRVAEQLPLSENSLEGCARPLPPLLAHHAKDVVLLVQQAVAEYATPSGVRAADVPLLSGLAQREDEAREPGSLAKEELYRLGGMSDGQGEWVFGKKAAARKALPWFAKKQADTQPGLYPDDSGSGSPRGRSSSGGARIAAANNAKIVEDSFEPLLRQAAAAIATAKAMSEKAAAEAAEAAELAEAEAQRVAAATAVVDSVTEYLGSGSSGQTDLDPSQLPASLADTFGLKTQMPRMGNKGKKGRHKRRADNRAREAAAAAAGGGDSNGGAGESPKKKKKNNNNNNAKPAAGEEPQRFAAVQEPSFK